MRGEPSGGAVSACSLSVRYHLIVGKYLGLFIP